MSSYFAESLMALSVSVCDFIINSHSSDDPEFSRGLCSQLQRLMWHLLCYLRPAYIGHLVFKQMTVILLFSESVVVWNNCAMNCLKWSFLVSSNICDCGNFAHTIKVARKCTGEMILFLSDFLAALRRVWNETTIPVWISSLRWKSWIQYTSVFPDDAVY